MRRALFLPLLLAFFLIASCDKGKPSAANSPADDATSLPDHYGLFALSNGKLQQIQEGEPPSDFPRGVEFILYDKRVATMSPGVHFYIIARNMAGRELPPRNGAPPRQPGAFDPWSIPLDAKVRPIASQTEMVRITPAEPLDPGCYALEDWAQFFVDQKQMNSYANSGSIIGTWQAPYANVSIANTTTFRGGARQAPTPPSTATFRFSSNGTYTANLSGASPLKEKGTWKIDGTHLITTTTAANDGRPIGTADTVELLQLDANVLIFKAPTGRGGPGLKHTFQRIN